MCDPVADTIVQYSAATIGDLAVLYEMARWDKVLPVSPINRRGF